MTVPMTLTPACSAAATATPHSLWHRVASAWHHLCDDWRRARNATEAARALAALDDRLLRDIGIARDDIHRIVHDGQGR